MDSQLQQESNWDLGCMDRILEEAASTDVFWNYPTGSCADIDAPLADVLAKDNGMRKRERDEPCTGLGSKACREKMRRGRMNERFSEMSFLLEPDRPAKTDKCAILSDAIRVLNQLKTEAQELKEANEMLEENIKTLKVEKNELREEKLLLKTEKERIEERVKSLASVPAGYLQSQPAAYHPGVDKMMVFPSYGGFPMWQWIPPVARDVSKDHELRSPMA